MDTPPCTGKLRHLSIKIIVVVVGGVWTKELTQRKRLTKMDTPITTPGNQDRLESSCGWVDYV